MTAPVWPTMADLHDAALTVTGDHLPGRYVLASLLVALIVIVGVTVHRLTLPRRERAADDRATRALAEYRLERARAVHHAAEIARLSALPVSIRLPDGRTVTGTVDLTRSSVTAVLTPDPTGDPE